MAKLNGNEAPEAITKIQLLTKTSTEDKTPLDNIELDRGEPLVNIQDKTLIIGTENGDAASDSVIILGRSRDKITDNNNGSITITHYDGNVERYEIPVSSNDNSIKVESVESESTDIKISHTNEVELKETTSQSQTSKLQNGSTFIISDVNYDAQGHITGENIATLTLPKYSSGSGISISQVGETNEYTITNAASVTLSEDLTSSMNYIVAIDGSNGGSITPRTKVLTGDAGITITTGIGNTFKEKAKLIIRHSNSVTAKTSYSDISTDNNASVNIVTPMYDAEGHITGTVNQKLTVGAASTDGTKLGTIKTGYTDHDSNIRLKVESSGDAYITLTETAITSASGAATSKANTFTQTQTIDIRNATETTEALVVKKGQIKASTFNATSDARLKENFQPLIPEKSILDLPTYKFDFINGNKNQIGCKAQDLQEICPEIVNEGGDGYLSIQESKIVYLLLEEVKKLRKEVDELRGK